MWIQKVRSAVLDVAYANDGRSLLVAESDVLTEWDVSARAAKKQLQSRNRKRSDLVITGTRYLVWGAMGTRIRDIERGRWLEFELPEGGAFQPGPEATFRFLSRSRSVIRTFDVETRKSQTLLGRQQLVPSVNHFAFSPDGARALVSGTRGAVLVDLSSGEALSIGRPGGVQTVTFSPDSNLVMWVYCDHWRTPGYLVEAWEVDGLRSRYRASISFRPGLVFATHPTAPLFVSVDRGGALTLFSTETGEPTRSLDFALGKHVTCVAFSPDGLTCAVGGSNKRFAVFDVDV